MEEIRKKLIQLRTKLEFYKKLKKKIEMVMNSELRIEKWDNEVHDKISALEHELYGIKSEMNLSDEEWNEDEILS